LEIAKEGRVMWKSMQPQHFLQRPPAIACAEAAIDEADRAGVTRLEAHAGGKTYWLSLVEFRRLAFRVQRGGFEPQLAVMLDRWHRADTVAPMAVQLTLFDPEAA
jgi:hypothetical protein